MCVAGRDVRGSLAARPADPLGDGPRIEPERPSYGVHRCLIGVPLAGAHVLESRLVHPNLLGESTPGRPVGASSVDVARGDECRLPVARFVAHVYLLSLEPLWPASLSVDTPSTDSARVVRFHAETRPNCPAPSVDSRVYIPLLST